MLQYTLHCQLMLKRRSTLQTGEKSKRNKMTQYLLELDRCLQIPSDDKLMIRRKIKQGEQEVLGMFEAHRRDKNYHELQIKLRKIIQGEKTYEKRFTINHGDRKKSEYNQRVYSQNSQNASFKNSVKASPQKQEGKKTLITFDICQLKKKMEDVHNESVSSYHLTGSKSKPQVRLNSIGRMNTSINRSRQSSFDRLPLKEQKKQPSSSKIGANNHKQPSKITLRITDKRQIDKQNVEITKVEQPKIQQEKTAFQNSNANVSYSSSIKTLLMSKLKDQKEKIYLKDPKKVDELLVSNRSIDSNQTAIKKSVRPMTRDQPSSNHKEDAYDKHPMYIQTTEYSQDQLRTQKKLEDFGYKNLPSRCEKLQTLLSQPSDKYGQFYMKIKDIINSKNY